MSDARGARGGRRGGTRTGRLAAVVVTAALAASGALAGCGREAAAPGGPVGQGGTGGDLPFPSCDGLPTITADPAVYRDEPSYGNPMELVEDVQQWAAGVEGFEELWLDRDHNAWVHVGVHVGRESRDADIASLQAEVVERFPGEGVVVVAVPHTLAELEALADRVLPALAAVDAEPLGGSSLSVPTGVVGLYGVTDSPEARDVLAGFAGEPLCVDLADPADVVPEGEQPTAGAGWRLLGHEQDAGEAFRTGVATTDGQLARLWAASGLAGDPPAVDWQREVVVWFGAVWGSSCPIRLDDVAVSDEVLHGVFVVPGAGPGTACTGDARAHSYVLAVERSVLPRGPFVVQLDPDDPPPGAPEERTVVDADLSTPGATARDDQLHADAQAGVAPLVADGGDMPPNGARYVWRARPGCEGTVIGPLDGSLWRFADGEGGWALADGQEVTLHPVDDDLIVMSTPDREYSFVRTDETCG